MNASVKAYIVRFIKAGIFISVIFLFIGVVFNEWRGRNTEQMPGGIELLYEYTELTEPTMLKVSLTDAKTGQEYSAELHIDEYSTGVSAKGTYVKLPYGTFFVDIVTTNNIPVLSVPKKVCTNVFSESLRFVFQGNENGIELVSQENRIAVTMELWINILVAYLIGSVFRLYFEKPWKRGKSSNE